MSLQRKRSEDVRTLEEENEGLEQRLSEARASVVDVRQEAEAQASWFQEQHVAMRRWLEQTVEEASRAEASRLALQQQLLELLQEQAGRTPSAQTIDGARALLKESAEEAPGVLAAEGLQRLAALCGADGENGAAEARAQK